MAKRTEHANGAGNPLGPQLTPAREFRLLREMGQIVTLESTGRVVKWRPVNLVRMLERGEVPDKLTAYVAAMLWQGTADDTRTDAQKAIDWQNYLELVASASLLHPVVCENPVKENEIHADDLTPEELAEIEQLAVSPTEAVRRFRGEQARDVAVAPEGDALPQAAE